MGALGKSDTETREREVAEGVGVRREKVRKKDGRGED